MIDRKREMSSVSMFNSANLNKIIRCFIREMLTLERAQHLHVKVSR